MRSWRWVWQWSILKFYGDAWHYCPLLLPSHLSRNGKVERMIRTINIVIRTLLLQASMPPSYWVEALNMDVHLLNIIPPNLSIIRPLANSFFTKYLYMFISKVFVCLCYPNISSTSPHELSPRSTACVLGYSPHHHKYKCLDLSTNKVSISRLVIFNEYVFPLSTFHKPTSSYDFLDTKIILVLSSIQLLVYLSPFLIIVLIFLLPVLAPPFLPLLPLQILLYLLRILSPNTEWSLVVDMVFSNQDRFYPSILKIHRRFLTLIFKA